MDIGPQKQSDSDEYRLREGPDRGARRTHMNVPTQDESCQVCVCSAQGKDEYCSNRPAANLNECLMMEKIKDNFNKGLPFELKKNLAYRIRRGLSWWCRCY